MSLIIGIVLLITALTLVLVFLLTSHQFQIPIERRRPFQEEPKSQLTRFAGSAVAALERFLSTRNIRLYNRHSLELAGLRLSQADFFVLVFAGACVGALMGTIAAGPLLAIPLFLASPVVGQVILNLRITKRRAKFDEQLSDTIQLLTGGLRAGHSILRAIDASASESASPTAEEMRRVVSETSLGKDLLVSLNDIAERMKNEDFVWISQAIQINREVGGNLAEVLDQVNETIRERSEIKGQIKALAAEGKMSAYILMGLPFGLVLMLLVMSPGYMNPMLENPLGWVMIGVSGILFTIGGLWLRKIIDLKF